MDLFLEKHRTSVADLNVVAYMNDLESIKKSIVSGLGVSIVSACSVKDLEKTRQILLFPLEESAHKHLLYCLQQAPDIKALRPAIHEVCAAVLRRGADSPLGSRAAGPSEIIGPPGIIGIDMPL